ncbi:MAG: alpha/beta hydrolase, partial [Mucilaginibacter sp.]
MPFIKVTNGTNLFYKDWGSGIPVIFVHGWCINCDSWEYIMQEMAEKGSRCIAYDQRGCGRSDQPWRGYDFITLADDLAALIERLDLDKVVLVGHSMGCGVIAQYIADYGDLYVLKAVLIGTTTPCMAQSASNPNGIERAYL